MGETVRAVVRSSMSIRTIQKDTHYYPPVALLYYCGVLAVLAAALRDFAVSARYSAKADSTVTVHAQSMAGRFKSRISTPGYCNDPTQSLDTSDIFLQALLGRICATNITCGHWFADRDVFFASGSSWTLTTFLSGDPYPAAIPNVLEYNIAPLLDPNFPTLNATAKAAALRAVFGNDHLFKCSPSYFVEQPEAVTIALAFNVSSDKLPGGYQSPTVRFWDSNGLLVDQITGGLASMRFSTLFKIDFAEPSYIRRVAIPSQIPAALTPAIPAATVRHLGLEASLAVTCTNFYDEKIQDQVVCDARASVNYDSLGPLPKTTFSLTTDGVAYTPTPLTPSGVVVAVSASGVIRYPDFYAVILWGVSTFVIIEAVESVAQILVKVLDVVRKRMQGGGTAPVEAVKEPPEEKGHVVSEPGGFEQYLRSPVVNSLA